MTKRNLAFVGILVAVVGGVVAVAVFAGQDRNDYDRELQNKQRARRQEFVKDLRYRVNSISAVRISGPDDDVLEIDVQPCDRKGLQKLTDIPQIHDDLARLRFVQIKCANSDDHVYVYWQPQ